VLDGGDNPPTARKPASGGNIFFALRRNNKDAVCNPFVISVLLSVYNKPRPLTSQAIISPSHADAKLPDDQHLAAFFVKYISFPRIRCGLWHFTLASYGPENKFILK